MEKDNRKSREDARKTYNDTVRVCDFSHTSRIFSLFKGRQSLVKFVRKRDPRYKLYLQSQSQSSSHPPPILSAPIKAQQKPPETYVEQDWQKVDTKGVYNDLDWAAAEGNDLEEWECVACRKTFRSEAAWDSHERSKKHMKEVERLKREMQADDQDLDLDDENEDEMFDINDQSPSRNSSSSSNLLAGALTSLPSPLPQFTDDSDNSVQVPNAGEEKYLIGTEILDKRSRGKIRKQTLDPLASVSETETTKASSAGDIHLVSSVDPTIPQEPSKRDKRRARQAKKIELEDNNNLSV